MCSPHAPRDFTGLGPPKRLGTGTDSDVPMAIFHCRLRGPIFRTPRKRRKRHPLQVFRVHIWGSFENHLLSCLRHWFRGFQWKFLSFWCETGKADSCGKCGKWWGKVDNNGPFPLFQPYITWSHLISYPKRFKDLRNMYWMYPPRYHSTSLFTLTGRVMHSNPYTEHLWKYVDTYFTVHVFFCIQSLTAQTLLCHIYPVGGFNPFEKY